VGRAPWAVGRGPPAPDPSRWKLSTGPWAVGRWPGAGRLASQPVEVIRRAAIPEPRSPGRDPRADGRRNRAGSPGYRVKRRRPWTPGDFSALAPRRLL